MGDDEKIAYLDLVLNQEKIKKITPPLPIIVVENQTSCTITVNLNHIDNTIVVFKSVYGKNSLILKESIDKNDEWKFRSLLFEKCEDCSIMIVPKLVACKFVQCKGCTIVSGGSVFEKISLIGCERIVLSVHNEVNIIQITRTKICTIFQYRNEIEYIVDHLSVDITCNRSEQDDYILVGQYGTLETEPKVIIVSRSDILSESIISPLNSIGTNLCINMV